MKKHIIGIIAFAAIAVAAGWGYIQNKQNVELSELVLANIEALATGESGSREDCEQANDTCDMLVIYPDGQWGLDVQLGHKKKPGWL